MAGTRKLPKQRVAVTSDGSPVLDPVESTDDTTELVDKVSVSFVLRWLYLCVDFQAPGSSTVSSLDSIYSTPLRSGSTVLTSHPRSLLRALL